MAPQRNALTVMIPFRDLLSGIAPLIEVPKDRGSLTWHGVEFQRPRWPPFSLWSSVDRGWIVVPADAQAAIERGEYIATNGPEVFDVLRAVDGDALVPYLYLDIVALPQISQGRYFGRALEQSAWMLADGGEEWGEVSVPFPNLIVDELRGSGWEPMFPEEILSENLFPEEPEPIRLMGWGHLTMWSDGSAPMLLRPGESPPVWDRGRLFREVPDPFRAGLATASARWLDTRFQVAGDDQSAVEPESITRLVELARQGDRATFDELAPMVGVRPEDREAVWQGTRARLGVG